MPNRHHRHHDAEFMMSSFKVKLCPRVDQHNWKACPWKHEGESQATRRHPSLYSPAYCADLKMHGKCAAGDRCPFSHNTFELSLHPERYKTTLCNLGEACNRDICFFAHSISELRTPGSSTSAAAGTNPKAPQAAAACASAASELPVPVSPAAAAWSASTSAGAAAGGGNLPLLFQASQLDYHQQHLLAQEHLASFAAQQQLAAMMLPGAHAATAQHVMAAQVAASAAAAAAAAVLQPTAGSRLRNWVDGLLPASGNALGNPAASYGMELAAATDSFTSQGSNGSSSNVCNFLPLQTQLAAAASLPLAQSLFWPQLDVAGAGKHNFGQQAGGMLAAGGEESFFGSLGQANMPVHVRAMLLGAAAGVAPNAVWPSYP